MKPKLISEEIKEKIIDLLDSEDLGHYEISFKIQDSRVVFIRQTPDERREVK